jgi:sodium/bile acid cotransporter 7
MSRSRVSLCAAPWSRFVPDRFTLLLGLTVAGASLLPAIGRTALVFGDATMLAISLLFFLHGARLSREAVLSGLTHWRLHLLVMCCTFLMFPLLGVLVEPLARPLLTPNLYVGVLFLCLLPSTLQSSIAFTAIGRGNVPAAVCSTSASSFLGIVLTPLLASMLLLHGDRASFSMDAALSIVAQLLLPFVAGQALRRWIGAWIERRKPMVKYVDQGAILLVVYTAFSEAVVEGLWHRLSPGMLAGLVLTCMVLLAIAISLTTLASRWLGFDTEDEIAIVFCSSKKSLASGIPLAKVLFASGSIGMIILPLMLFHQIQLMVCAMLAQRYARRARSSGALSDPPS